MSLPRQIVCFVIAAALCIAGGDLIYDEFFLAHRIMGRVLVMGVFLLFIGGLWLWIDFGAPLWQRLTRTNRAD